MITTNGTYTWSFVTLLFQCRFTLCSWSIWKYTFRWFSYFNTEHPLSSLKKYIRKIKTQKHEETKTNKSKEIRWHDGGIKIHRYMQCIAPPSISNWFPTECEVNSIQLYNLMWYGLLLWVVVGWWIFPGTPISFTHNNNKKRKKDGKKTCYKDVANIPRWPP